MSGMSTDQPHPPDQPDRLEQEIYVTAGAEEVWALVSRPGWWVNEGEVDDHPVVSADGDLTTLAHPTWGQFLIETVETRRPEQVVFRWSPAPGVEASAPRTTVELTIEPRVGGVVLRVVESGFAGLSDDETVWRRSLEDQTQGWANELKAARAFVTSHRG